MKKRLLVLIAIGIFMISSVCYAGWTGSSEIWLDKNNQGNKRFNVCATTIGWNNTSCYHDVIIVGFSEEWLFLVIKRDDGKLRFISMNQNIEIKER